MAPRRGSFNDCIHSHRRRGAEDGKERAGDLHGRVGVHCACVPLRPGVRAQLPVVRHADLGVRRQGVLARVLVSE